MSTDLPRTSRAIHIDDLAHPVNTSAALLAMEEAKKQPVDLSIDAVISTASELTGLADVGPQDFRSRLSLMLREVDRHPNNTAWGRLECFREMTGRVANRLRLIDFLESHPEIRDVTIERPIFIAGLPRSGTTDLVNVMAADSRFRTLPNWEAQQPTPDPGYFPSSPGTVDPV